MKTPVSDVFRSRSGTTSFVTDGSRPHTGLTNTIVGSDDNESLMWEDETHSANEFDSEHGTLLEALAILCPGQEFKFTVPKECQNLEPVFSGRLGQAPTIKRSFSTESIETQLSLFSCSEINESHLSSSAFIFPSSSRKRNTSSSCRRTAKSAPANQSRWVEIASKRKGFMDKMMRKQHLQAGIQAYQADTGNELYDLLTEEEADLLFKAATKHELSSLKSKSGSALDLTAYDVCKGENTSSQDHTATHLCKKSVSLSKLENAWSIQTQSPTSYNLNHDILFDSRYHLTPPHLRETKQQIPQKLWPDDHKHFSTSPATSMRVNDRIHQTVRAVDRLTGHGDRNQRHILVDKLTDYPNYTMDDFARLPRMPQKLRISPHLSSTIKKDIELRMGKPRYHEIRARDIEQWNKGYAIDRKHRNLKVFNWLHSLQEADFDIDFEQEIDDSLPHSDFAFPIEVLHIESCDEPDLKPIYASC